MTTLLDSLAERARKAADFNNATEKPPAIVLWPDGEKRWLPVLPALRKIMPDLWTLGAYQPGDRQGPATWVKWMLGEAPQQPPGIPVLYMPGVERLEFRSLEDFPEPLRPIAELQFRGTWWTQQNGKDWTPLAFLKSNQGGLGLDVANGNVTVTAVQRMLARLAHVPVSSLRKGRLEAPDFWALLTDDLVGSVLEWLDNPDVQRQSYSVEEWSVFREYVQARLGVDVDADGPLVAAERLMLREGPWGGIWARYAAGVPNQYGKVHLLLEKLQPTKLVFDRSTSPVHNREQEGALRADIAKVAGLGEEAARKRIHELDVEHGMRRDWVWARLGQSPMARLLGYLAELAKVTQTPNAGSTPDAVAAHYREGGWRADAAALQALSLAEYADEAVIHGAVRALYLPWLERTAAQLCSAIGAAGYPASASVNTEQGDCIVFADGLRWDVGMALGSRFGARGATVEVAGRWVPFPPVTATSKPAVSPVGDFLGGGEGAKDFTPTVRETGKVLNPAEFRKLLDSRGVQVLDGSDVGQPHGVGWTEFGDIDRYGHEHGCKTARHVEGQIADLLQRVLELLHAGWKRVRIVTDHGWLLVPGGLPKVPVPSSLTEERWGRCALVKRTAKIDLPALRWHWDASVDVTYAPGTSAFYANMEYAHGGLTLQECYTPVLTVCLPTLKVQGALVDVRWVGLRCRIKVTPPLQGARIDIRTKVADAGTSIVSQGKSVAEDGSCSIAVENPDLEGSAAFVVFVAADGAVVDKRQTVIGGGE